MRPPAPARRPTDATAPTRRALCWIVAAAALAPAFAGDEPRRILFDRRADGRPPTFRGEHPAPPAELAPPRAAPATGAAKHRAGASATRPHAPTPRDRELVRLAREAALRKAHERAHGPGATEYFRAGFWAGLQVAFDEADLAVRDRSEGRRRGGRDPRALALGHAVGRDDGEKDATELARSDVERQFLDLSNGPEYRPRALPPLDSAVRPVEVVEPSLGEILGEFPPAEVVPAAHAHLAGWRLDARRLWECTSLSDVYDAGWSDGGAAFRHWIEHGSRSRVVAADREIQREAFLRAWTVEIDRLRAGPLRLAWRDGYSDGWSYGAFVRAEWEYRKGYHEGFVTAAAGAATAAYHASWIAGYARAYESAFARWSEHPHPRIRSVELLDGNEDGVFEPGETVAVVYEVVNYGGAGGRVPLELRGGALAIPGSGSIELPARGVAHGKAELEARISDRVRPRTDVELEFAVAEHARSIPLRVARPLQLVRHSLDTRRDNLSGRVRLRVEIENRSTRPVAGRVDLVARALDDRLVSAPIPAVRGVRAVDLELDGLDPLDLVGGNLDLEITVHAEGVVQDRLRQRLPASADDLDSPDLPLLLERQAGDGGTSSREIARARELLMDRLREDWRAAVRARGNPYKKDYKRRTARTALGDLVRRTGGAARSAARPEVFEGLRSDVAALADELPGAHPLLRKYVRRLAARLP